MNGPKNHRLPIRQQSVSSPSLSGHTRLAPRCAREIPAVVYPCLSLLPLGSPVDETARIQTDASALAKSRLELR